MHDRHGQTRDTAHDGAGGEAGAERTSDGPVRASLGEVADGVECIVTAFRGRPLGVLGEPG